METADRAEPSGPPPSFVLVKFLRETYPHAFSMPPKPLKIGIGADIKAAHPNVPRKVLNIVLHRWTSRPDYLDAIVARTPRVGLDGEPHGEPDENAARLAAARLAEMKHPRRKTFPKAPPNRISSIYGTPDFARARSIRLAAAPGKPLSPEDRDFLVGLLRNHPEAGRKIGAGVAEILVSEGRFMLVRADGTKDDFSVAKCLGATQPSG